MSNHQHILEDIYRVCIEFTAYFREIAFRFKYKYGEVNTSKPRWYLVAHILKLDIYLFSLKPE